MKKIFTLFAFAFVSILAYSQSSTVVISQFYGGGGGGLTSGATYTNDYVELHNVSDVSQDISGWSVQYGSSSGQFGSSAGNYYVLPAGTVIPSGGFLLIQLGNPGLGGDPLPVTPDLVTTNVNASASSGKIALANINTSLGCGATASPCILPHANIIDLVAYGAANNAEGGTAVGPSSGLTNQQGVVRKEAGCQDSDNNADDFQVVDNPIPRNSASPVVVCSTLPLHLTSFKGSLDNGVANLSWTTANEEGVRGFRVEKSTDGRSYNELTFVSASNNSNNTYAATDKNLAAGANYYRLVMLDKDGSSRISNVVVLHNRSLKAQVFPNPVVSNITISHDRAEKGAIIRIMSVDGKQVKQMNVQAGSIQTSFAVSELVKGNYLLVFESNGAKATSMFTKQ